MGDHRYTSASVAPVRHAAAREHLSAVGLPEEHVLFAAVEDDAPVVERLGGRDLLRVGSGGDGDDLYGVDCRTGEVLHVGDGDAAGALVGSSPAQLRACLRLFEDATAGCVDDDPEALEALAASLRSALAAVDPVALAPEQGFWGCLLFDVALGDYVAHPAGGGA